MGHKHHHKKKYYSVTDRPFFKVMSSILTAVLFAALYYVVVILMERPGLALVCSLPCVMLLIWVAVKQRYFWWIWLVFACPCVALMVLFRQPDISLLVQTFYWVISYGMCQWLIIADSRAKTRMKRKRSSHHHHDHHSPEPSAPRPKDELLEKLFADAE